MKDEMKKDMEGCNCGCGCPCCGSGGMMHHHGGGKHWLFTIGIVALVYGVVNWAMVAYLWPAYMGWIVGGLLLIFIGWLKKMKHHMMMK